MKAQRRAAPRCRARRASLRPRRRAPVRRKKVKGPVIPVTARGGKPPSYFELLQEAVLTLKDTNAGASLPQIRRQLQRRYKGRFDQAGDIMLTTALERLADRGKVIYKRGYRYQFNAPKVAKPTSSSPSVQSSYSGGTSLSRPMSGSSAPSTNATSRTSGSYSDSANYGIRPREAAKDSAQAAPKDASEGKSSSSGDDDASSTAPESASSTASRGATSSKKR